MLRGGNRTYIYPGHSAHLCTAPPQGAGTTRSYIYQPIPEGVQTVNTKHWHAPAARTCGKHSTLCAQTSHPPGTRMYRGTATGLQGPLPNTSIPVRYLTKRVQQSVSAGSSPVDTSEQLAGMDAALLSLYSCSASASTHSLGRHCKQISRAHGHALDIQ